MACIGDAAQENDSIEIDMGIEEGDEGFNWRARTIAPPEKPTDLSQGFIGAQEPLNPHLSTEQR